MPTEIKSLLKETSIGGTLVSITGMLSKDQKTDKCTIEVVGDSSCLEPLAKRLSGRRSFKSDRSEPKVSWSVNLGKGNRLCKIFINVSGSSDQQVVDIEAIHATLCQVLRSKVPQLKIANVHDDDALIEIYRAFLEYSSTESVKASSIIQEAAAVIQQKPLGTRVGVLNLGLSSELCDLPSEFGDQMPPEHFVMVTSDSLI